MNRLLLILIITFGFQSWTNADDIKEFEIEGMSIGDSLLDYFNLDEIKDFDKISYPDKKYIFVNLENYFVVIESRDDKSIDENYITTIITDAGYDVQKIEVVSDSVSEIREKYGAN